MKKYINVIIILILVSLTLLFGIWIYNLNNQSKDNNNDGKTNTPTKIEKNGFVFEYQYLGNNKFSYTIKGNLPTPCYKADVSSLVRESYPEQVVVNLVLTPPDKDVMCIQVLKEYEYQGEANVSEKATFEFDVQNGD